MNPAFDLRTFNRRSPLSRLHFLLALVEVDAEQLQRILGVDTESVRVLLKPAIARKRPLSINEEKLLSILSFLLLLTDHTVNAMPRLWRASHFFVPDGEPPWNEIGLAEYLTAQGVVGLSVALLWIRRFVPK